MRRGRRGVARRLGGGHGVGQFLLRRLPLDALDFEARGLLAIREDLLAPLRGEERRHGEAGAAAALRRR